MTLDEAKKELADVKAFRTTREKQAVKVVLDALRTAEGQVAAMREAAAKVAEDASAQWSDVRARDVGDCMTGIAKTIRALPAPAARTDSPARTYEDGVRDAAKAVRSVETRIVHRRQELITEADVLRIARERSEACAVAVEALLSPASAPTPGPTWETAVERAYKPDPNEVAVTTPPAPVFDAEAALVAQAAQIRHAIGSGRQYVTADDLLLAYEAGIAAGRKP